MGRYDKEFWGTVPNPVITYAFWEYRKNYILVIGRLGVTVFLFILFLAGLHAPIACS